jgi:hypothetical protein
MMNCKRHGRTPLWPILRCSTAPSFSWRLRKTTKSLGQHSRSPVGDVNSGPTGNEARVLTTRPRRSAKSCDILLCDYSRYWAGFSSIRLAIVINLQSVQTLLQMSKKCITRVNVSGI